MTQRHENDWNTSSIERQYRPQLPFETNTCEEADTPIITIMKHISYLGT